MTTLAQTPLSSSGCDNATVAEGDFSLVSIDAEDSFGAIEGIEIDVHDIKTTHKRNIIAECPRRAGV